MFDSLYVPCPTCKKPVEFQSKADQCFMNVWRSFDDAPTEVLWDVINEPEYCRHCGNWMALIDPAVPPGVRPRPKLQAVAVRTPENPQIHSHQPEIRWWPDDKPFSFDDVPELSERKE